MLKIALLDGYVDEPTCLGVPPYISPYPRYIAGSISSFDKNAHISYMGNHSPKLINYLKQLRKMNELTQYKDNELLTEKYVVVWKK